MRWNAASLASASADVVGESLPYLDFIRSKAVKPRELGLAVRAEDIHPALKAFNRDIVAWAIAGGRRAIFARFGLHKTIMQLELQRLVRAQLGGQQLQIAPLNVILEGTFAEDAARIGVDLKFVQSDRAIDAALARGFAGQLITNYESVREGKIAPERFNAVSLDEADCLRGMGGTKTFREFMTLFPLTPYRFVATATPSPNDHVEILAYAAFLGVMDIAQAKTRFFRRNSEKADELTLHPHKEGEFWAWVNSWSCWVQKPSDLGYSDEGYDLPPIKVRWHEVPSDHRDAGADTGGQGRLLKKEAIGVVEASREKRDSIDIRIAKMLEIIREHSRGQAGAASRLHEEIPGGQPGEVAGETAGLQRGELSGRPGEIQGQEQSLEGGQPRALPRADQGLSHPQCRENEGDLGGMARREQGAGGGHQAAEQAQGVRSDARGIPGAAGGAGPLLCDLPGQARQGQEGTACRPLPSDEHGEGPALPQLQRGDRADEGRPGTVGGGVPLPRQQWCVWCDLNDEQRAAGRALASVGHVVASIAGSTSFDDRVRRLQEWRQRRRDTILSKPSMLGAGLNLQQCNRAIFLGIGFKFKDMIQAIHRVHRYGQTREVIVDIIHTEAERAVVEELRRKWREHDATCARMSELIRIHGLGLKGAIAALERTVEDGLDADNEAGPGWEVQRNDAILQAAAMGEDSVGLVVTSIPFSTQYEYTPCYNDLGHSSGLDEFFVQMGYLTRELLRILQPGRRLAVHVKDRVVESGRNGMGFRTIEPFHAACIDHYRAAGFAYLGMVTIVTDVVRENAGTYRLGWSEQCKDASGMGVGLPEYLLLFRKPPSDRANGYADEPVRKAKPKLRLIEGGGIVPWDEAGDRLHKARKARPVEGSGYSRARWQTDACGYWRSSGDRVLAAEDLVGLPWRKLYQLFRGWSYANVYDHDGTVALIEAVESRWSLPPDFALMPVQSWHPEVWTDVARMRGANTLQSHRAREQHLCPLPFDIVDRAILDWSNPGELVFDPFGGLMTVPLRAVKHGRRGAAVELNPDYFADGVRLLREQDAGRATASLFDLVEAEARESAEAGPDDEDDDGVNDRLEAAE